VPEGVFRPGRRFATPTASKVLTRSEIAGSTSRRGDLALSALLEAGDEMSRRTETRRGSASPSRPRPTARPPP
jgi:hypothetical protein